jgi:hypothetical protein
VALWGFPSWAEAAAGDGHDEDKITCNDNPNLCGDNHYCHRGTDDDGRGMFKCKNYAGPGDNCYRLFLYAACNPEFAFCYARLPCWSDTLDNDGTCVEYGANTCSSVNKDGDSACENDE